MPTRRALRARRGDGACLPTAILCTALALCAARGQAATDPASGSDPDPFRGAARIERGALISAVLERNASLSAARFALEAAAAREPAARGFDAPMLEGGIAPAAFGSDVVDGGWRIGVKQRLAFLGRSGLRGRAAQAEARALSHELDAARVELAAQASALLDAYALAAREGALADQQLELLSQLQQTATSRYASGDGSQQDPLLAELELARAQQQRISLRTREQIARAQLNALMHRGPDELLPPLPDDFEPSAAIAGDAAALESEALHARPELRAQQARVDAAEAALSLAQRDLLPDVALAGSYDRLWQERDLRGFVGLELELPFPLRARRAAVGAARAELERERSLLRAAEDAARLELGVARARLAETDAQLALAAARRVPAARDRAEGARAAFESGRSDLAALIEALRARLDSERELERARAEQSRRRSELQALLGRLPGAIAPAAGAAQ